MPRFGRVPVSTERFEEKFCPRCGETKPLGEFFKAGKSAKAKLDPRLDQSSYCKPCSSAWAKAYHARPETLVLRAKWKRDRRLRTYGLTKQSFREMLLAQGNRCAICLTPQSDSKFVVDHCHTTGKVRGLLCTQCNSGIGMFGDDIARIAAAIVYIEESKKESQN